MEQGVVSSLHRLACEHENLPVSVSWSLQLKVVFAYTKTATQAFQFMNGNMNHLDHVPHRASAILCAFPSVFPIQRVSIIQNEHRLLVNNGVSEETGTIMVTIKF
jgi:hypothetical protein